MRRKIHLLGVVLVTFLSTSFSQEVEKIEPPVLPIEEMNENITSTSDTEQPEQSNQNNSDNSEVIYDIDAQTYEEVDDDFVPSEEIPADEPIQFPTNI